MTNIHCPNCGGCKSYNRRSHWRTNCLGNSVGGVGLVISGVVAGSIVPPLALVALAGLIWIPAFIIAAFVGGPSGRKPFGCWICNYEWDEAYRPPTRENLDLRRMGQILLDEEEAAARQATVRRQRQQSGY